LSVFSKTELSFPIQFEEPPVYLHLSQHGYRHNRTVANIAERSMRCCQFQGAFIRQLPTERNNILIVKTFLYHWLQVPHLFIVVDKRLQTDLCTPLQIHFRIANSCARWCCNFKRSHSMGDGWIFLKKSQSLTL
jgi:hypothetical protein